MPGRHFFPLESWKIDEANFEPSSFSPTKHAERKKDSTLSGEDSTLGDRRPEVAFVSSILNDALPNKRRIFFWGRRGVNPDEIY